MFFLLFNFKLSLCYPTSFFFPKFLNFFPRLHQLTFGRASTLSPLKLLKGLREEEETRASPEEINAKQKGSERDIGSVNLGISETNQALISFKGMDLTWFTLLRRGVLLTMYTDCIDCSGFWSIATHVSQVDL